ANAENGKMAVEETQQHHYDLILMDCNMPLMDGFDATRLIRAAEGQNEHIIIIALTASARPEDRQLCLEAGMDDFLSKPVRAEEIRYAMQKWLNRSRASASDIENVAESSAAEESPINMATLHALSKLDVADDTNSRVTLIKIFMDESSALLARLET